MTEKYEKIKNGSINNQTKIIKWKTMAKKINKTKIQKKNNRKIKAKNK